MNIKNINRSFVFGIASFLFLIASHNASALTISPVRMEVSGDPGSTITKNITIFNDSKTADETYYVTYSNFESQGETGSPSFVEPKNDLGTWITSPEKSVLLKAGETKTIPFTMTIPKDAYSGGHFAAIFFGNSPEGGQVSVGAKTGSLVLLTVTGKVKEAGGLLTFGTVDHKLAYNALPISMEYRFKNDGDDRVKPEGNVTIHNMFYIPVKNINANNVSGNILPHSTRLFSGIDWTYDTTNTKEIIPKSFFGAVNYQWKNFALGPYFVHLDLAYGSNNTHSVKNIVLFVLPWQLLVVIIIILTIVIFGSRAILKSYNKSIIERARMGMTNTPGDANHA